MDYTQQNEMSDNDSTGALATMECLSKRYTPPPPEQDGLALAEPEFIPARLAVSQQNGSEDNGERHIGGVNNIQRGAVRRRGGWLRQKCNHCRREQNHKDSVLSTSQNTSRIPEWEPLDDHVMSEKESTKVYTLADSTAWGDDPESEQEDVSPQETPPETSRSSSLGDIPETPKTSSNESLPRLNTPGESSDTSSEGVDTPDTGDVESVPSKDGSLKAALLIANDGGTEVESSAIEGNGLKEIPRVTERKEQDTEKDEEKVEVKRVEEKEEEGEGKEHFSTTILLLRLLISLISDIVFSIMESLCDCRYFLKRCTFPDFEGTSQPNKSIINSRVWRSFGEDRRYACWSWAHWICDSAYLYAN